MQVTIATPEANSRIARRNFALSASGCTVLIAVEGVRKFPPIATFYLSAHPGANGGAPLAVASASQLVTMGELRLDQCEGSWIQRQKIEVPRWS